MSSRVFLSFITNLSFNLNVFKTPDFTFMRFIILFLTLVILCFNCKDTNSAESEKTVEETTINNPVEPQNDYVTVFVWVNNLRLREKPDTKSAVLKELKEGAELQYLEQKTDFTQKVNLRGTVYDEPWLKVNSEDGTTGWVYGGAVKFYKPQIDSGPSPYDQCFRSTNSFQRTNRCVRSTVAEQLKKDADKVQSDPKSLTLNLLNGEKKVLKNSSDTEALDYVSYDYRYYLPKMGYYVVRATYFEGNAYILVNDKSGSMTPIKGYPKPSPDFKHLIVTCGERNDYQIPTELQLLGFTDKGLEVIWEKDLQDYIPIAPNWINENNVEFSLQGMPGDDEVFKGSLTTTLDGQWIYSRIGGEQ